MSVLGSDSLLSGCVACIVAQTPAQRHSLETLALRTGFSDVRTANEGPAFPARGDPPRLDTEPGRFRFWGRELFHFGCVHPICAS